MTTSFLLRSAVRRGTRIFVGIAVLTVLSSTPFSIAVGQEAAAAADSPAKDDSKEAAPKPDQKPAAEPEKTPEQAKAEPAKAEPSKPATDKPETKPVEKDEQPKKEEAKKEEAKKEEQPKKEDAKKVDQPADKPAMPAKAADEKNAPADAPIPVSPTPEPDPEWVAKGVWTMPPTNGPAAIDFSLVGEYVGDMKSADKIGVQVRNLGDGEFEARVYQGGLPGQEGFKNEDPMLLFGRRSDQTLVLSGGPWAMFAGSEECKVIDASGTTLATLPRVERKSPTLGATPPEGAMVLFNGTDTSAFMTATMTPEGLLSQGADVRFMLGDFDLHLEFRIPHMPRARDQKRGNSGLYLQSRYECQILDSFGDEKVFNGLGALYRFKTPEMNMALPPLVWQTYDVHFTAARFAADGSKLRNAHVTSWVNGVMVQNDVELPAPTGAGQGESPTLLPTKLQDHGDPVRFRNVWVIDRGLTGGIEFPQMAKP